MSVAVDTLGRMIVDAGRHGIGFGVPPTITDTLLTSGTVGVVYGYWPTAVGGTPPYTWGATGVPGGLSVATDGTLSGTPTTAATSTVTFTATDSLGTASAPVALSLRVDPSQSGIIVTTSLPDGYVGAFWAASLSAGGGTQPYSFAVISGMPAWMSTDGVGNLSGTPTTAGTFSLTAQCTDNTSATSAVVTVYYTINPSIPMWFGAQLPLPPKKFTTTCSPPAPSGTNRGSYYTPGVGADSGITLQAALNSAAAATGTKGDVIVLQAGNTYNAATTFTLPARSGSGWIYVISSNAPEIGGTGLPAAGTRIGRADTTNMPALTSSSNTSSILGRVITSVGVAYYRLVGLNMQLSSTSTSSYVVSIGGSGDTTILQQGRHITFDRCYIAGSPINGCTSGVELDGAYMEITECRVEFCQVIGNADTHAIFIVNSVGPYKIHNNWLHAGGETTFFGGGACNFPAPAMPSDIEITNNHYWKSYFIGVGDFTLASNTMHISSVTQGELYPAMVIYSAAGALPANTRIQQQLNGTPWGAGDYQLTASATANAPGDAITGRQWIDKNMVEFKVGQRFLFDSNFLENAYGGGQVRSAFVLTSINQNNVNPWNLIGDMTVTNNVFTNCYNGGMQWKLQDSHASGSWPTNPGFRFLLRNNIFMHSQPSTTPGWGPGNTCGSIIGNTPPSGTGNGFGGSLIWDHNTFVGPAAPICMHSMIFMGATTTSILQATNIVWSNNIWDATAAGINRAGSGSAYNWSTAVAVQVTQPVFTNNVTVNYTDATLPGGNFNSANVAGVGFTSYGSITAATGYQLTVGSTYHAQGVSGLGLAYNAAGTADGTDIGCNITTLPTS